MLLERTIRQLNVGAVSHARALSMGRMGYLQWLGALPGNADYHKEAMRAHEAAAPLRRRSPAVAVFCDLLVASTLPPPAVLNLPMPARERRGGARMRRAQR